MGNKPHHVRSPGHVAHLHLSPCNAGQVVGPEVATFRVALAESFGAPSRLNQYALGGFPVAGPLLSLRDLLYHVHVPESRHGGRQSLCTECATPSQQYFNRGPHGVVFCVGVVQLLAVAPVARLAGRNDCARNFFSRTSSATRCRAVSFSGR